jgi:hypothetical protein
MNDTKMVKGFRGVGGRGIAIFRDIRKLPRG